MSVLLISLRHAPDDEISDIQALLDENHIDHYATRAGAWGVSAPGIWLKKPEQLDRAKALLDDYQQRRFTEKRAEYEQLKRTNSQRTFVQNFRDNPLGVLLYIAVAGLVLYFSVWSFYLL